jgi:[ribosomal protein S5]-alanine N-acetyltransferase
VALLVVPTARLDLVAASLPLLEAELVSPAALSTAICAVVPADWPPGEHDRDAVMFFRDRLLEDGALGWYAWYAVKREDAEGPATVVGTVGYFGPPGARNHVEIGYSVSPSWRRRGFAREMVEALVLRAFDTGVDRAMAHTEVDNHASISVLLRAGFAPAPSERGGYIGFARKAARRRD